jgi:hypothetical protein
MSYFVRLTLVLALAFAALMVAFFILKLVLVAAVFAAVALVALYAYNFLRGFARRSGGAPVRRR